MTDGTDGIAAAREAVRRARRRVDDERQAFGAFVHRLDRLAVERHRRHRTPVTDGGLPRDAGLGAVRTAFAETVLSVPHAPPETTVDDGLEDAFDADLAATVVDADTLRPAVRRRLVRAGTRACDRRRRLCEYLDAELDALEEADAAVAAIADDLSTVTTDADVRALRAAHADLAVLDVRRQELVADRREALAGVPPVPGDASRLPAYLVADETDPVLAALEGLGAALQRTRRDVERALLAG
jgi:hypothetical protein